MSGLASSGSNSPPSFLSSLLAHFPLSAPPLSSPLSSAVFFLRPTKIPPAQLRHTHLRPINCRRAPKSSTYFSVRRNPSFSVMEVEREVERRLILLLAMKETKELEEAVAALLDLARAEHIELFKPRTVLDLRRVGVECRCRGRELVLRWDGDGELQGLLEVDGAMLGGFRAGAAQARYYSEPMSDSIRVTKYAGVEGLGVRYVPKQELKAMVLKASQNPRPIGVPMSWVPGGVHVQGCSHK